MLIPTRTLGDVRHKETCPGAISCEPEISHRELQHDDQYLVLASDGLWDDVTSERAVGMIRKAGKPQVNWH